MNSQKRITNIVFTKNRPMQLHGYLEGLRRCLPPHLLQTVILYKPDLFDTEYEYCFSQFPECRVIREVDFHKDMLNAITGIETEYMLFGVDDVVYFDGVDFDVIDQTFQSLGADMLGFSFRLDKPQMPEDIAANNLTEHHILDQTVQSIDWTKGQTKNTRYPFELCATLYRTEDVKRIVAGTMRGGDLVHTWVTTKSFFIRMMSRVYPYRKILKKLGYFYDPNTLESWCCRHVQKHPERFGRLLAFDKTCAKAIQVNMVNTSTANTWDNSQNLTVEVLNKNYKKGDRIDIDAVGTAIKNRPSLTQAYCELFKIKNVHSDK